MWNWLNCYLSGRHEFSITCEPGTVYLRCIHCSKRSPGWALEGRTGGLTPAKAAASLPARPARPPFPFAPRGLMRKVKSA